MKNMKYMMMALFCLLFTACMDGNYDEVESAEVPYGNNAIKETNVVTIAQLKDMYRTAINTDYRDGVSYKKVTSDLQIKGNVTGNDIEGNLYNEVVVQDETAAIVIAVQQGGMFGFLPLGAEILVELNGLYVGNYALQPVIGVPFTNNREQTYVSRMSRMEWQNHFKITGNRKKVEPQLFGDNGSKTTWDLSKDAGKLGVIKNVSFRDLKANSVYADPAGGKAVSWYFKEYDRSVMLYTSPFCDFANQPLPKGKVNITGIVKRFNNNWEFVIRSIKDVEEVK